MPLGRHWVRIEKDTPGLTRLVNGELASALSADDASVGEETKVLITLRDLREWGIEGLGYDMCIEADGKWFKPPRHVSDWPTAEAYGTGLGLGFMGSNLSGEQVHLALDMYARFSIGRGVKSHPGSVIDTIMTRLTAICSASGPPVEYAELEQAIRDARIPSGLSIGQIPFTEGEWKGPGDGNKYNQRQAMRGQFASALFMGTARVCAVCMRPLVLGRNHADHIGADRKGAKNPSTLLGSTAAWKTSVRTEMMTLRDIHDYCHPKV